MPTIDNIQDIAQLVTSGYTQWQKHGQVDVKGKGDLLQFNYTHGAQIAGHWTYFERIARGLIINRSSGEIVARPFDKFFNWAEGGRTTDAPLINVTEKMDGVLGLLYRDGGYRIATRGSLDGQEAAWATEFLCRHHDLDGLGNEWTLILEIVNPANRLIVDYGDTAGLFLLAARNRHTGEYLHQRDVDEMATQFGFPRPSVHHFNSVSEIIEQQRAIDGNQEGWVAEFADGQRFKFKGDRYLELSRLAAGLSFGNTVRAFARGELDILRARVPEEFEEEFNGWVNDIRLRLTELQDAVEKAFRGAPKSSRKRFADWVREQHPDLAPYLFQKFDGKDIRQLILQRAFADRSSLGAVKEE